MINYDMEMKMSALPAMNFSPAHDRAAVEAKSTTQSTVKRRGSFLVALSIALSLAACTGGAGLDIPIGPVDHSCPDGNSCGGHR